MVESPTSTIYGLNTVSTEDLDPNRLYSTFAYWTLRSRSWGACSARSRVHSV